MNIQDAIRSGRPFRRKGWVNDDIYVVYHRNDIVLTLATDSSTPIELDVQDILADDWYLRDEIASTCPTNHETGEQVNGMMHRI